MIAVFDDGNINIDNVTFLKLLIARDAMTDDMVDRGADRFRETAIVQASWNTLLFIDYVIMTNLV